MTKRTKRLLLYNQYKNRHITSDFCQIVGLIVLMVVVSVFVACSAPLASNPPEVVQPVNELPTMPPVDDPTEPTARNPIADPLVISQVLKATPETQAVIVGNNQFALDFYSQLVADKPTDNQFFSPWSIATAFALAGEGARGETADEIWDAFGLGGIDPVIRREAFKAIADAINRPSDEYDLAVANSFWQRYAPPQEYTDIATNYYNAEVFDLPKSPDPINQWAAAKTNDKIKKVIGKIDDELIYLIVNALYFKGVWQKQFDKELTKDGDFWTGSTAVTIPLMHQTSKFRYSPLSELQAIELPYVGDRVSMLVLLPRERDGIRALEQSLNSDMLISIRDSLSLSTVDLTLPSFKLETKYNLIDYLESLGIELAFDKYNADFESLYPPGVLLPSELYISKATQNAFIEVNERGTEAAALTAVEVGVTSIPPQFIADHPFIFLLQDNETDNILFMGKVTDPS